MPKQLKTYEYQGGIYPIAQLSAIAPNHISESSLRARINFGMDIETALTKPIRGKGVQRALSCGATNINDCFKCPNRDCTTLSEPVMPWESIGDYIKG